MIPQNFHPNKIGVASVIAMGRGGSLFFQGFFEGHPNVVVVPTMRYPNLPKAGCSNLDSLASSVFQDHLTSFFSFYPMKTVDYKKFKPHFIRYLKEFGVSRKNVFIAIHYAFARAAGQDVEKVRYIMFQSHLHFLLNPLMEDFPGVKIIFLARDPRATLLSVLKSYAHGFVFSFLYPPICFGFAKSYPMGDNVLFIRHEDVHLHFKKTIEKALIFLGIPFHRCLRYSSFCGRPYTGSSLGGTFASSTGFFSSKPSKKFVHDEWKWQLSPLQLSLINFLCKGYIEYFEYPKWDFPSAKTPFFDLGKYADSLLGVETSSPIMGVPRKLAGSRLPGAKLLVKGSALAYLFCSLFWSAYSYLLPWFVARKAIGSVPSRQ